MNHFQLSWLQVHDIDIRISEMQMVFFLKFQSFSIILRVGYAENKIERFVSKTLDSEDRFILDIL